MEKDYIGSIKSEIAKVDDNVSVNADILDMDRLSISSPAKYIATYNKPRDWVLDQDEARVLQVLRDVATPEKASKVGSVAYGAGEALRRTSQLPGRIAQDMVGKDAWVFPNSNPESARRAYNNMLKLSVQAEQNRADYVAEHGVDTDVYGFTSSALEAVRDMFLAGGIGKAIGGIGKTGSLVYAGERVLPGATGVAERFATMQGRKAASKAIKASIFASALANEMPDRSVKQAAEYMDKTGDYDLKYYDPTADMGINTAVSLANAWIESSLGIEGVVPDMLFGTRKASRWTTDFIKGYLGERSEEFIQNIFDQGGDVLSGYRQNIDVAEAFKESAPAGILGGVFRSGASAGMYYLNRRRMIRQLEDAGVNKKLATSFVDKYLENGIDKTLNNVSAANELTMRSGDAFDKMKAGIKSMLELQGWATKMVDPNTGTPLNIDEYVDLTVNTQLINTAVKEAIRSGITIDEFLDIAEFVSIDNFVTLRPLGSVEEIQTKIDAQDAIIKRQQELKKTGAGDDTVLREAKIKKAILQKARLNKIATNEIQRVNVETAKTPETIKEIENATKDVEILNNSETPTDFNNKLENLTTEQKAKRLGNAVIKKIFGNDKLGFDSVITLPEYTNAKTAIINSAERILDYAKKHRSYGIYTDLRNALNLMQTVNRENFTEFASTPALDGNDVIAQNAFLYHFLFSDADTTSAFIDSYIQRAEASIGSKTKLSKKDLVGQALKATDDLMQIRAESAGIERKSIYKEDGSFADENVAAMFVSYQNQFVDGIKISEEKRTELKTKMEEVKKELASRGYEIKSKDDSISDHGSAYVQIRFPGGQEAKIRFAINPIGKGHQSALANINIELSVEEIVKSVDSIKDFSTTYQNIGYTSGSINKQGHIVNGFYDPELNVILLGKNWNTMTLPHEFAHYWLNTLFNVYKRVQSGELQANAEWVQEKKEMFAMLGINETQMAITRGQHEKFARMTEAYLTGIGVSKEINQTFKEYFKWVPEKYKSILQLGYLDDQGKIQYPLLDQKAVDFFNRWYENASLPSLPTSPERQDFMNVATSDGSVEKVSIKEMNDREKEFAQDAQEQNNTDQRLYTTLDENMPANIKPVADAQKVVIGERSNFLKESESEQKKATEEPKRRWYERKSRGTESQLAQEYIEKNPEHAREVIFGDPELIPNDTGIDRATLINTYMAINNITPQSPEWATLHTNIAINQSLAGTQLALSNDKSYGTYLDALREIEDVLELKAATNYAGSKQGARERFNTDIQRFLNRELPEIFATAPNSKERETALRVMFEKARTTFSGNTTGSFLNQVDLEYAKAQKGKTEAFMRWAINQIKKDAGAKLSTDQQAKLLQISAKAQQALLDLDNRDSAKAVAAAQELRNWQLEKQKMMGVSPQKFSLFGDWAPRAMLASFNTLVVANLPSTAINTAVVNATKTGLFGKNNVSKGLIDAEIKRIKEIYGATGMNLAQMEKPTSPSLLHGEKYSTSGQKWYDPYVILGKEDNFFRVPTFVNTLAQIASTDAKASGRNADDVFKEYLSLNNQTDEAKLARKQALAVANMAVFTQNGALASCLNHIRSELNKLSRVTFGLDPKGFGLGNLIAPFLTTGANIAEMGIRGSLAPLTTITTMVNSWRTGKSLDPMKKLALRMDWTYFTVSAIAMALLSALTSDDDEFYTDPYRTGRKYDPSKPYDSINLGGVWLDLDFFGPFAIPIRTSAKVIQAWKKDNGIFEGLGKGYAESAKYVLGDIPLAESIINNQVNWAVKKPGSWASSYVYNQANKLIPAQVKPVSRAISRANDWVFEPFEGTTVGRKFNRNYGFDGAELTSQDLIELFTIKLQLDEELNQKID